MIDQAGRTFIARAGEVGLHDDFLASGSEVRQWVAGMGTTLLFERLRIYEPGWSNVRFQEPVDMGRMAA